MPKRRVISKNYPEGSFEIVFERLFSLYHPKVKGFLMSFLNDESTADDLAQEVFVGLLSKKDSLKEIDDLESYLFVSSKNALWRYFKTQKKAVMVPIDDIEEKLVQIEQNAAELEDTIHAIVSRMSPRQRECFSMSRFDGFTNDEIAARMGISKRTVETHISSAIHRIKTEISKSSWSEYLKSILLLFLC